MRGRRVDIRAILLDRVCMRLVAPLGLVAMFTGCTRTPDHETQRLEFYRKDSHYCSQYASKREEARELLAWTWPQTEGSIERRMKQEWQALTRVEPLDIAGMIVRETADYEACMIGQGWEKASLAELAAQEKARIEKQAPK